MGDVRAAGEILRGVAHRTPVLSSATLDRLTGAHVVMKAEHLQRTGAFKFRGAYHALARLAPHIRSRGVVAYSSGNHGQAVALAARLFGCAATVVMPHDAPPAKRAATEGYGAAVVGYDRTGQDRAAVAAEVAARTGGHIVAPFDDPHVLAGQGTVALELIEDAGRLDVLVVPLGGGGLFSGCLVAATALCPGIRCYGVEPVAADDFARSLAAGERVSIAAPVTIADSLATQTPGELTYPIIARLAEGVVSVSDGQLLAAMRFAVERLHQVLEPGGAAGLAALLASAVPDVSGRRVGVILSGGNVGAARLAELLGGGSGR